VRREKLISTVSQALDHFVDAFADARQRDRTLLTALVGYVLVWTLYGVIAKSSQDLHPDMTELIAWSRDLALGYTKHPPFAALAVRGWFALFPVADWTYYLLAISTSALTLWFAWLLFTDYLDPTTRLIAVVLLTFIPFFNLHALKFNVNTILMPLWAVTVFWFLRSYKTRSSAYAALTGVGAALCMTSKYWSIFLLGGLALAAVSDSRRAVYFRSMAPWITVLIGVAVLSPHIGWLEKHDFVPMQYAMLVHGDHSLTDAIWADLRYLVDAMAYASAPIAIILLAVRPSLRVVAEMAWPADRDRRLVAVTFWATLLLPILPALVWGIEIHGIWTMAIWSMLPILLLLPVSVDISRPLARWIVGAGIAFPLVMVSAAPGVAIVLHEVGIPPKQTHIRMLAKHVENAWRDSNKGRLRYVGGDADLAYGVLTYAPSRPDALPGTGLRQTLRLAQFGAALVCFSEETACIDSSSQIASRNPASRKLEIQLVRNYLGLPGRPQGYVIYVVPPNRSSLTDPTTLQPGPALK